MNTANILAVADAIESHSIPWLGFNMRAFFSIAWPEADDKSGHACGTCACVAGWAYALTRGQENVRMALAAWPNPAMFDGLPHEPRPTLTIESDGAGPAIADHAAEWLGLTLRQAAELFYPEGPLWSEISAEQAVRTLRHLAATGIVAWSV